MIVAAALHEQAACTEAGEGHWLNSRASIRNAAAGPNLHSLPCTPCCSTALYIAAASHMLAACIFRMVLSDALASVLLSSEAALTFITA
jgi:hypothetical protein